jgi:predicted negative regulator of RcsB-dependent stress response
LADSAPGDASRQQSVASLNSHHIAVVLQRQGDLAGALASLRRALSMPLANADPGNPNWQQAVSSMQGWAGEILLQQGDIHGAQESYRSALATAELLVRIDATNMAWTV